MNECFAGRAAAIDAEVRMTPWMRSQGFEVDVTEMAYHVNDGAVRRKKHNMTITSDWKQNAMEPSDAKNMEEYYALTDWTIGLDKTNPPPNNPNPQPFYVGCQGEDTNGPNAYWGIDLSPWELMFVKFNRGINPLMYELATQWVDGNGYSSYEHCH